MGAFHTNRMLYGNSELIPVVAERIGREFEAKGYEVATQSLMSGGADISITKGGAFKAVLGMKTAFKVSLTPQQGYILFDARVGIFGQQVLPSVISLFFYWPVLITQIWGMVQQAKLDDRALEIAEQAVYSQMTQPAAKPLVAVRYCTECGKEVAETALYCDHCGARL